MTITINLHIILTALFWSYIGITAITFIMICILNKEEMEYKSFTVVDLVATVLATILSPIAIWCVFPEFLQSESWTSFCRYEIFKRKDPK